MKRLKKSISMLVLVTVLSMFLIAPVSATEPIIEPQANQPVQVPMNIQVARIGEYTVRVSVDVPSAGTGGTPLKLEAELAASRGYVSVTQQISNPTPGTNYFTVQLPQYGDWRFKASYAYGMVYDYGYRYLNMTTKKTASYILTTADVIAYKAATTGMWLAIGYAGINEWQVVKPGIETTLKWLGWAGTARIIQGMYPTPAAGQKYATETWESNGITYQKLRIYDQDIYGNYFEIWNQTASWTVPRW